MDQTRYVLIIVLMRKISVPLQELNLSCQLFHARAISAPNNQLNNYLQTPAIHDDDDANDDYDYDVWIRLQGANKSHHHNNKTQPNLLTYHRSLSGLRKRM